MQGARRLTYSDALTAANQVANALIDAGLQPGDRVAVLSRNRIEYVVLYVAAAKAGVALVPLNYRLAPSEWVYILDDSRARVLIAAEPYLDAVDRLGDDLKRVERFVALDLAPRARAGWEPFDQFIARQPCTPPQRVVREDADLFQMYTSGTTGRPKGAVLTHRAVTANLVQNALACQGSPGERSLVCTPLYHAGVVPSSLTVISQGGALWILAAFDPSEVARALSEERIGFVALVPSMIQMLLVDVPDIAERRYGASPIAERTLRDAMAVFGCDFLQAYGLTETTQALTCLSPADHRRGLAERPGLLRSVGASHGGH